MSALGYADQQATVRTPGLFGRVMGLVAVTVAFATGGVYLARDWGSATWWIAWLVSLGCLIGLQVANAKGNRTLALTLLFAFGLTVGMSVSTTVNYYAATDPTALRQAFGATALFVGGLGTAGYAIRRDLSFLYRFLFRALLAVIDAGPLLIIVRIPAAYAACSILRPADVEFYTVADCNPLRHADAEQTNPL